MRKRSPNMFAGAVFVSTLVAVASARIYERCELARDLLALGGDRDQVATWVCIAYHESRFDTAAVNPGSGDHGLFQISQLYWCGPGKACGAPCSAFRDEDISNDVKCVLQIYKEHTRLQGDGFLAWVVYPHNCKQNAKKYIVDCDKSVKNVPVKWDDRARHIKPSVINETKLQTNNPYTAQTKPRYLAINSLFQGSYANEFESNYYENKGSFDWLNFKVDNIDDLKLPTAVNENQIKRIIQYTTPATLTTPIDPDLIGIKPPSPRRIESNQFRRRKTFTEPLFLKNKIGDESKSSKITPPLNEYTETKLSLDLSENPFLKSLSTVKPQPVVHLTSQDTQLADLSRYYNIKTPQTQESSSIKTLTYEDLSQNPFLNSLPGFQLKSSAVLRPQVNTVRPEPIINKVTTSSSQFEQHDSFNPLTLEDLSQNPFLSHLLTVKTSTESPLRKITLPNVSQNYIKEFKVTTVKPITQSTTSTPSSTYFPLNNQHTELIVTTKSPKTSFQRGKVRYSSVLDRNTLSTTTEKLNTQTQTSSTSIKDILPYSVSSQSLNNINVSIVNLSTVAPNINNLPLVSDRSTTTSSFIKNYNRKPLRIEINTSRTPSSTNAVLFDVSKVNEFTIQSTRPPTTLGYRSSRRFWEESRNITSTTSRRFWEESRNMTSTTSRPRPVWRTNATSTTSSSPQTKSFYSTTQKTADTTEASTVKTTQSIFDLYLRPSTRPSFKPFEFTSFNRSPFKLSIFSGGTTKPPPSFTSSKKQTITEKVPANS